MRWQLCVQTPVIAVHVEHCMLALRVERTRSRTLARVLLARAGRDFTQRERAVAHGLQLQVGDGNPVRRAARGREHGGEQLAVGVAPQLPAALALLPLL